MPRTYQYLVVKAGTLACASVGALAQVPQAPIGATLRYEVAVPGGAWGTSVEIAPGDRVEWRAVVSFTGSGGTGAAQALGRIYYQPLFSNVDNTGSGSSLDQLGEWRNGGISGQGNTTLQQGILPPGDGDDSNSLSSGYGRVGFAFTSRSTTAGGSGPLTLHRHDGTGQFEPAGSWIRIAGSNAPEWYPPAGLVHIVDGGVNRVLRGVVSDNAQPSSSFFIAGTQNLTIFRQAFVASSDVAHTPRVVTLTSEPETLQRAGGQGDPDDLRFMTWAREGEGGSTATLRVGVAYLPATIVIVPAPGLAGGGVGVVVAGALMVLRRRRARRQGQPNA